MDDEKLRYTRAASTLKVHGILSIVFGAIGTLAAVLLTAVSTIGSMTDSSYNSNGGSVFGLLIVGLMIFVFWTLPHIYLIIAGSYLVREPAPQLAKTFVIINLVIGVFWNLVLLIFAIINLTEITDYTRGYHAHKRKK